MRPSTGSMLPLGNAGATVTYLPEPQPDRPPTCEAIRRLVEEMNAGKVETLLILGGNPVYNAPGDLNFAEALKKVATSIHLSRYRDETSLESTWHLPEAHFLEAWGDARSYDGTYSIVQPLIEPLWGGRSAIEVLAGFLGEKGTVPFCLNGPQGASLKWVCPLFRPGYDLVRSTFKDLLGGKTAVGESVGNALRVLPEPAEKSHPQPPERHRGRSLQAEADFETHVEDSSPRWPLERQRVADRDAETPADDRGRSVPLPPGEGWGEGASDEPPPAASAPDSPHPNHLWRERGSLRSRIARAACGRRLDRRPAGNRLYPRGHRGRWPLCQQRLAPGDAGPDDQGHVGQRGHARPGHGGETRRPRRDAGAAEIRRPAAGAARAYLCRAWPRAWSSSRWAMAGRRRARWAEASRRTWPASAWISIRCGNRRRLDFDQGAAVEPTGKPYPLATTQDHHAIDAVGAAARDQRIGELVARGHAGRVQKPVLSRPA